MKGSTGLLVAALLAAAFFIGRYLYKQPRFVNGDSGPNFSTELATGAAFELRDLRGQYVLLDFWGSWCAPCLKALPELRALYADYHDRAYTDADNFELISIGVETDAARWRQASDRLQLPWPYQILDLTTSASFFNSPLAEQYGITEVPTTYLLDPEGQIIGVNLSFPELRKLLDRRLANADVSRR